MLCCCIARGSQQFYLQQCGSAGKKLCIWKTEFHGSWDQERMCFVGDAVGEISGLINITVEVFYLSAQTTQIQVFQCYVYRLIFQVYVFLLIQGDMLLVVLGRLLSYSAKRVFQWLPSIWSLPITVFWCSTSEMSAAKILSSQFVPIFNTI